MQNLISVLESIIGPLPSSSSYSEIMRYFICGCLVIIVVGSIFKIFVNWCKR